jgi:hypothetical protein
VQITFEKNARREKALEGQEELEELKQANRKAQAAARKL